MDQSFIYFWSVIIQYVYTYVRIITDIIYTLAKKLAKLTEETK